MDTNEEPLTTMVKNLTEINGLDTWIGAIGEEERSDKREWNSFRYDKMVALRNILLGGVREVGPPMFLSLDSDILLNRDALKSMVANLNDDTRPGYPYAACGGKAYMTTTGTSHPSYGMMSRENMLRRQDSDGVLKVDVIMAIKLMLPAAYNVDYEWASQGEDIGWSQNCQKQQLNLLWDGTYTSKHVMRPKELECVDVRAGY